MILGNYIYIYIYIYIYDIYICIFSYDFKSDQSTPKDSIRTYMMYYITSNITSSTASVSNKKGCFYIYRCSQTYAVAKTLSGYFQ